MQTARPWGWGIYSTNHADGERKLQEGEFQFRGTDVSENVELCEWTQLLWVNLFEFTVKQKQPSTENELAQGLSAGVYVDQGLQSPLGAQDSRWTP